MLDLDSRVESCRPHVGSDPPNTDRLDQLEEMRFDQKEKLTDACNHMDKLSARREKFADGHPQYPKQKDWEDALRKVKETHRTLRDTSRKIDTEMRDLSAKGYRTYNMHTRYSEMHLVASHHLIAADSLKVTSRTACSAALYPAAGCAMQR